MRMAEIYLIAAEYDIVLNGGGQAMGYIKQGASGVPVLSSVGSGYNPAPS